MKKAKPVIKPAMREECAQVAVGRELRKLGSQLTQRPVDVYTRLRLCSQIQHLAWCLLMGDMP